MDRYDARLDGAEFVGFRDLVLACWHLLGSFCLSTVGRAPVMIREVEALPPRGRSLAIRRWTTSCDRSNGPFAVPGLLQLVALCDEHFLC